MKVMLVLHWLNEKAFHHSQSNRSALICRCTKGKRQKLCLFLTRSAAHVEKSQIVQRLYMAEPRARGVSQGYFVWLFLAGGVFSASHPLSLPHLPNFEAFCAVGVRGGVGGRVAVLSLPAAVWMLMNVCTDNLWLISHCLPPLKIYSRSIDCGCWRVTSTAAGRWAELRKNLSQFWQMHRCCFGVNALSKCVFSQPIDKEDNIPSAPL